MVSGKVPEEEASVFDEEIKVQYTGAVPRTTALEGERAVCKRVSNG